MTVMFEPSLWFVMSKRRLDVATDARSARSFFAVLVETSLQHVDVCCLSLGQAVADVYPASSE